MQDIHRRRVLKTIGGTAALVAGGAGTAAAGNGNGNGNGEKDGASGEDTIVDVASATEEQFNVLVAAVKEAGLVDTLSGNRQLTVLAPTDDAFGELGVTAENVGDVNFEEAVGASLTEILTYHVTPGRRYARSIVNAPQLPTLNGESIEVTTEDGVTTLNDDQAEIDATDIEASNGVIHVIDGVLLP